ncbi:uncharacterized protein JCM6883_007213 [Sporobolomyces salmoneus]|uniref:uncharacterized protein n=1 Tax=Sporobolomyces salmoneus TaxID=183962 RepID=UPI0031759FB5
MSIPSLPLEIIAEIAFHLRARRREDVKQTVSNGKSISLVCRQFAPIGQALRWRLVKINWRSTRSLAQHFEKFPQLAELVRVMIRGDEDEDEDEDDDDVDDDDVQEEEEAESLDNLLLVLNLTLSLNRLNFKLRDKWRLSSAFSTILRAASALPQLRKFEFKTGSRIEWTIEVAQVFNAGFPALRSLVVVLPSVSAPEAGLEAIPLSTPRKKLEKLQVCVAGSETGTASLSAYIFNQLDPSVLHLCNLTAPLIRDHSYHFLSTCPRLTILRVQICSSDSNLFSDLVHHLPHLRSLVDVDVYLLDSRIVEANISLERVLAACPATLKNFVSERFSFSDYESIPVRRLPDSPSSEPVCLVALRPLGVESYVPLLVWKDETEEGSEARWYRSELEEED